MATPPTQPGTGQRVAAVAGAGILRALFTTLRIKIIDPADFMESPPPGPVIYAFWHNRILAITAAFLRSYPPGRCGVKVLTSASKDGMWLGALASRLGMGSVRGSSSRRGATAMRELLEEVAKGYDIAITPDGPRGPRYALGPGMIYLAQKAQIPIVPVHAKFGRCWQLRTWDGFCIPQPFSRVEVKADKPLHLPLDLPEEAFEAQRRKIESVLRAGAG
ncbi:MAG: lysophospholipid acyltransferase family protein [Chthoniobacterales bacterium]|jgi:lysophospholipid acyltransferase (LPLAT)-like uncharacterized protein